MKINKIMKISFIFLCCLTIVFELYILANSNKIAEIPEENEILFEIEIPPVPLINYTDFTDDESDESDEFYEPGEPGENETDETKETERTMTEPETKIKTDAEIKTEPEPETTLKIIEVTEDINNDIDNTENIEITTTAAEEITNAIFNSPVDLTPKNVPIFMYHTSSESNPGALTELYVKPSEFEKQVQYLDENGFTFCTFDDYYDLDNIDKPVFLTFDDGYRENYTEIFPILKKYNAKITIFLMINSITDFNLTLDMITEMSDSGLVKFESHTVSHPSLVAISLNDTLLTAEIQNSKTNIEEITGKPVLALAYPNGEFNDTVIAKTKEFYLFGLRKDLGMHNTKYDQYEIRRVRINRSTSLTGFINYTGN